MEASGKRAGGVFVALRKLKDSDEMEDTLEIFEQARAAYLLYSGVKLVRILPGSWCRDAFANENQQASKALDAWRSNTALVRVREYAKANTLIIRRTKATPSTGKVGDH